MSGKASRTLAVWQGSAAQQAEEMVPDGVTVISSLHTVNAKRLAEGGPLDEDVLICGDRKVDKARVARLIEEIEDSAPSTRARSRWPASSRHWLPC